MALTTSNVKPTLTRTLMEGLLSDPDDWSQIFNLYTQDAAAIRLAAFTGGGDVPSWDGSSDLTEVTTDSTGAITMAYSAYGYSVVINKWDQRDNPEMAELFTRRIAGAVNATMRSLAFAVISASFTDTVADGQPLCDTAHTMTSGTRSNKGTAALDRSAFEAAILALRQWQNYTTQPMDLVDSGQIFLVVDPTLEVAAHQIVGSPFTSDQNQVNVSRGRARVIVSNRLTDTNDWFVVIAPFTPYNFWMRGAPEFDAIIEQKTKALHLQIDFAAKAASGPQPEGVYGSAVA